MLAITGGYWGHWWAAWVVPWGGRSDSWCRTSKLWPRCH